jgi:hypothetical protein
MFGFLLAASIFNALLMPVSVLLPVYTTDYLVADVNRSSGNRRPPSSVGESGVST